MTYGDWLGTCIADDSDRRKAREFLREQGDLRAREMLVDIKISHIASLDPGDTTPPRLIKVTFRLAEVENVQDLRRKLSDNGGEIITRAVHKEMTLEDFLALFKRFYVQVSFKGALEGATIHEQ